MLDAADTELRSVDRKSEAPSHRSALPRRPAFVAWRRIPSHLGARREWPGYVFSTKMHRNIDTNRWKWSIVYRRIHSSSTDERTRGTTFALLFRKLWGMVGTGAAMAKCANRLHVGMRPSGVWFPPRLKRIILERPMHGAVFPPRSAIRQESSFSQMPQRSAADATAPCIFFVRPVRVSVRRLDRRLCYGANARRPADEGSIGLLEPPVEMESRTDQ